MRSEGFSSKFCGNLFYSCEKVHLEPYLLLVALIYLISLVLVVIVPRICMIQEQAGGFILHLCPTFCFILAFELNISSSSISYSMLCIRVALMIVAS